MQLKTKQFLTFVWLISQKVMNFMFTPRFWDLLSKQICVLAAIQLSSISLKLFLVRRRISLLCWLISLVINKMKVYMEQKTKLKMLRTSFLLFISPPSLYDSTMIFVSLSSKNFWSKNLVLFFQITYINNFNFRCSKNNYFFLNIKKKEINKYRWVFLMCSSILTRKQK